MERPLLERAATAISVVAFLATLFAVSLGSAQDRDAAAMTSVAEVPRIDVVFTIDATGSMADEIEQVKRHLWATANHLLSGTPRPDVRFGLVVYRDRSDAEHTRMIPLTDDVDAIHTALTSLRAMGGGDTPEDVDAGLHLAVHEMNWDERAAKMIFLIGDARAKDYEDHDRASIVASAAARLIHIHTIQASGISHMGRSDFERIATATGGSAEVLTYREQRRHRGQELTFLSRGDDAFLSRRPLTPAEQALSYRELQDRRLLRRAPRAMRSSAMTRGRRRGATRGRPSARGSRRSRSVSRADFADSDVGGIITREAVRAAEASGVAY